MKPRFPRTLALFSMLACLIFPFNFMLLILIPGLAASDPAFALIDTVNMTVLIFVIWVFFKISGDNQKRIRIPAFVLFAGVLLDVLDHDIFLALYGKLPLVGADNSVFWDSGNSLVLLFNIVFVLAYAVIAIGAYWMGWRLVEIEDSLYGMQHKIGTLMLCVGILMSAEVYGIFRQNSFLLTMSSLLGYLLITILMMLFILLFYRAAFRPDPTALRAE